MIRFRFSQLSLLALSAVFAADLRAQAVYGSIVGTVMDASGAAVANAKVIIRNVERDTANETNTNDSGNYTQRYLIVGNYQVRVEANGFKTAIQDTVKVSVDSEARVDFQLQVGELTQTLEVSSQAPMLKTERSDVATTFDQKQVGELPILNRRFTTFQLMTPGVSLWPVSLTAAQPENPQGSYRLLVNGQSFAGVSHLLDGTDNHDAVLGWIVINPTLESVTEAKVTTADFDAEFGTSAAAVVSSQTKSGTNTLHGSAFEFLRNDHMQARNPFTQSKLITGSNRSVPQTQWNQFGGSIGGAIRRNKLFYFGDYQGTRRNTGGSVLLRVPSLAERLGDLSGLGINIYDPSSSTGKPGTRTLFNGAVIPTSRIAAQTTALLNLIPTPNITATKDQPNYSGSGAVKFNDDAFNVRSDYYQNEKIHWFGRYSLANFVINSPGIYGAAGGPGYDPSGSVSAFAGQSTSLNHSVAAGFDYALNPQLFTDFRFGFFRYQVHVVPNGESTAPATAAGIPGLNLDTTFTGGMPAFFINDYGNNLFKFGYALGVNGCNCPLIENEKQFQFVNNWTRIHGNHTFKVGADIRQAHNLRVPSDQHRAGQLSFNGAGTIGPNGGSGLATFLLGDVQLFQRYVSSQTDAAETQNRWFFYGQDTWRVTPKLTINYGLRWELYRPQTVNGAGKGGFVDQGTGEVLTAGAPGVGLNLNVKGRLTDFGPRVGIAYQLNSKTVIRTGYGRGYDLGIFGSIFGHNVTQNLPVLGIQTLQPANNWETVFTLGQGPAPLNPASVLNSQPKGPNGFPLLPNGVTPFIISKDMRLPTVDAWNFTVQRQLTGTLSLEAAYVGNKGTHVFAGTGGDYDPNQATLAGFGTLSTNQRRPYFLKFGWSQSLRYFASDASNNYNSLQVKADKRFSNGIQILGHYTWSRNMDFSGTYYPVDARYSYGPADNNRAHVFTVAGLWEVPFGRGRRFGHSLAKPLDYVIGGWQTNGSLSWASGLPFTPSYQSCNADRDSGWCRPDIAGAWQASNPSQFGWFNTSSAVLSSNGQVGGPWIRPQPGIQGNVGRNALWGPHFAQLDLSFFKDFRISERLKMQFRAESFNFTNHTNLGQPNGCVDCPGVAGHIFNTIANYVPRQWQMAARFSF